ncbi:MAG: ATP-binding cassette domain-containing protein [Rectinemataceae bacterium]
MDALEGAPENLHRSGIAFGWRTDLRMVKLEGLGFSHKIHGKALPAFSGLDAEFPTGSISAIVGPSGCGKTSLLRVLAGLAPPSEGLATIDGTAIQGVNPKVSIIFQDFGLLPWKTVRANVELPLRLQGMAASGRKTRVDPILEELGLAPFSSLFPARLSGGMRQRVAVARALASRSEILLMDEPFSSLDAMTRESLQDTLLEVHARHRSTVVIVTHSIEEAAYLADRIYVMGGRNPGRFTGMLEPCAEPGTRRREILFPEEPVQKIRSPGDPGFPLPGADEDRNRKRFRDDTRFRETTLALRRMLEEGYISTSRTPPGENPALPGAPSRRKTRLPRFFDRFLRIAFAAIVLGLMWAGAAQAVRKPFLPPPGPALERLVQGLSSGSLLLHLGASTRRIFFSLLAAGPAAWALGLLSGRVKAVGSVVSPFIYLLHPLPKVAFLPILMLFLGLGDGSKVALMGLVIFGQLFVGGRDAANAIQAPLVDSVLSLGKGRRAVLRHVILPGTLPELFSSLRVSLGTAIAVLFLSETFASMDGLGWYIMDAWSRVDYPDMYAAIVALSLFGLTLYVVIDLIEAVVCRWRETD